MSSIRNLKSAWRLAAIGVGLVALTVSVLLAIDAGQAETRAALFGAAVGGVAGGLATVLADRMIKEPLEQRRREEEQSFHRDLQERALAHEREMVEAQQQFELRRAAEMRVMSYWDRLLPMTMKVQSEAYTRAWAAFEGQEPMMAVAQWLENVTDEVVALTSLTGPAELATLARNMRLDTDNLMWPAEHEQSGFADQDEAFFRRYFLRAWNNWRTGLAVVTRMAALQVRFTDLTAAEAKELEELREQCLDYKPHAAEPAPTG